ncbi:MAG: hypothetical protein MJZ93_06310 [Paludibacteraceae bacterium]|nr:hypothetical protein [Paludibacteraceae bacterium]
MIVCSKVFLCPIALPLSSHFFPFPPIQKGTDGRKEDLGRTVNGRRFIDAILKLWNNDL